ncbi:MAG: hypothetical protein AAF502_15605 [Bacteroidota bacterium]
MTPKQLRVLFLIVSLFLIGQYIYIMQVRNFFPAIVLPRFGYSYAIDNILKYERVDMIAEFSSGDTLLINFHDLFSEAFISNRYGIIRNNFHYKYSDWEPQKDPEFLEWIEHRVESFTKRDDCTKVVFRWEEIRKDLSNKQGIKEKTHLGDFIIKLH